MTKGDMILVKWVDIRGTETWCKESEFTKAVSPVILSPGIFINEDENVLRIAVDLADDGDLIGTVFPKGCILSISPLNIEVS